MYYFIINPNSSSGKGLLIWKSIEPVLKERGVTYHPFFTKNRVLFLSIFTIYYYNPTSHRCRLHIQTFDNIFLNIR